MKHRKRYIFTEHVDVVCPCNKTVNLDYCTLNLHISVFITFLTFAINFKKT